MTRLPTALCAALIQCIWPGALTLSAPERPEGADYSVAALAPEPALAPDDLLYASPTKKDHIGRIIAPVKINGQGPFRMIVDTGASHSTVSPQLARVLGLDTHDQTTMLVNGITGTAEVPSVRIDSLEYGELSYKSIRLPVIWAPLMAGADGILGIAGLKSERLTVDFIRNRVTISRSQRSSPSVGFFKIPAMRLVNGLMAIDARVGGVRTRAIVDTGSQRSLGNVALQEALGRWRNLNPQTKVTDVYGSTSAVARGELSSAPVITLGKVKIASVELVYGDFHIFDVWDLRAKPALILGMDILGSVRSLGIDFGAQELYMEGAYYQGLERESSRIQP
jgi:predicted aspartyl protease